MNRSAPPGVLAYEGVDNSPEDDFVDFYEAQWPRLVAALAWSLPPGEDPRDLAQEAFARAYQRWREMRDHPRPDAWLYLTAYRLASSLRRRLAVRRRRDVRIAGATHDIFEGVALADLLSNLPLRERTALLLRHHYGLSTREAAAAMGCPEGTMKSLLARGRKGLRRAMEESESEA